MKVPYPYVLGKPFKPLNIEYNKRIIQFNKLVARYNDDEVILKDGFKMSFEFAELMAREYPEWKYYLPKFDLRNKIVLDIGAGCGETARYYLLNNAKKVICIDNDETCIKYLNYNSIKFGIKVIGEPFRVEHLEMEYDFCKMDIEGYEVLLIDALDKGILNFNNLKPMIIECHSQYCINKLLSHGFKLIYSYRSDLKIVGK